MYARYSLSTDFPMSLRVAFDLLPRIEKLPRKVVKNIDRVYRYSKYGYGGTLIITTSGKIYDDCQKSGCLLALNLASKRDIESLYKSGLIEYWVYRDWLATATHLEDVKKREYAGAELKSILETLQLSPTKAQQRAIDRSQNQKP